MKTIVNKHGWLLTILLIGVTLRVVFMLNQGFMNDELSAWFRLGYNSFYELISQGVMEGDMHPAFYQVFLYYWSKIFGTSELALRFPALLFYVGSCLIIYKIAVTYFTKSAGIIAVLFLSILVFPIIDTTLSRPYTSGIFFSVVFYLGLFNLKHSYKVNWKALFFIILGAVGAMYSHYFAFFSLGCVGFVSIFFLKRKQIFYLLFCAGIAVLCFIPHIEITAFQLSRGGLQWLSYPDREWFFKFIYLFSNHSETILCAIVVLPVIAYFGNKYKSKQSKTVQLSIISFFSVLILGYIVSYAYTPILREKGMLFVLPLGLLAYGNVFDRFKEHHRFFIFIGLLIGFTVNSIWIGQLYKPVHYGALKEISLKSKTFNQKYGEDNIAYFGNFVNPSYFNYYYKKDTNDTLDFKLTELWSDSDFEYLLKEVDSLCKTSKKKYASIVYSNKTMHPLVNELIMHHYPTIVESDLYFNSGILMYGRDKSPRKYLDSITPVSHEKAYSTWDESYTTETYIGEFRITVGELKALKSTKSSYFLISGIGEKAENTTYRITVVAERQGESIELNDGNFGLYQHFDMQLLNPEAGKVDYFLPFNITDNLKNDDIVKVFIQNNTNMRVNAQKPIIYAVDLKK